MSITYQNNKDLPCDQLSALFAAVGWSDETKQMIPEYQKRGIGSKLVRKCIAVYPNSEWSLETIPERVSFYEGIGFEINNSPFLRIPCKWF